MIKLHDPYTAAMKQKVIDDYCNSISLSELVAGMREKGEYEHLRFIFACDKRQMVFGVTEFLFVSMEGYKKVVLNDLNYFDNAIYMEIRDCKTGRIEKTRIDIDYQDFKFILICWEDIMDMIFTGHKSICLTDDLMELDE